MPGPLSCTHSAIDTNGQFIPEPVAKSMPTLSASIHRTARTVPVDVLYVPRLPGAGSGTSNHAAIPNDGVVLGYQACSPAPPPTDRDICTCLLWPSGLVSPPSNLTPFRKVFHQATSILHSIHAVGPSRLSVIAHIHVLSHQTTDRFPSRSIASPADCLQATLPREKAAKHDHHDTVVSWATTVESSQAQASESRKECNSTPPSSRLIVS